MPGEIASTQKDSLGEEIVPVRGNSSGPGWELWPGEFSKGVDGDVSDVRICEFSLFSIRFWGFRRFFVRFFSSFHMKPPGPITDFVIGPRGPITKSAGRLQINCLNRYTISNSNRIRGRAIWD